MNALVDNDILLKGACYGLLVPLISIGCGEGDGAGVLGAAWFVTSKSIKRKASKARVAFATENLKRFFESAVVVEPSREEQKLAAEFELAGQRSGLGLDPGESQLCAVLISRLVPFLLTGDKRAIESLERLLDSDGRLAAMSGKVKCLEQLLLALATSGRDIEGIRRPICAEAQVDKTLAICFSCSSPDLPCSGCADGLQSYIANLRKHAVRILAA